MWNRFLRSWIALDAFKIGAFLFAFALSPLFAVELTQSVNPSVVPAGGTATWTLSAMAGPVSVGDLYSSGTAWGGTWTNQWTGNYSWGVSGGALWYAPGTCASESNYPQYINSGLTVGDAEFYYETLIPPLACQPQEDSVLIFRNVSCARYYMIRLDHFVGMDGCSSDPVFVSTASRLFYDTVVPTGNPCGTPGVSSGTFNDGVGSASITCIAKNTWYSVRLRVLLNNVLAKTWPTGSAEPAGWMLNATDSTLNTYTSGQFGFQAQQGQTAFKNMTISTVSSEAVTVTDNFPACVGNVTWLGGGGASHILSGNSLTWNVGALSSSSTGVTCTLTSSISNSCVGAVANVALPNNGNSVSATVNVFNFTLAKSLRSPSLPVTGNGPLTFQMQLCTSGSGTLGGVSLTGGGAAATVAGSSMITLVDNLSSNYSGIWNHTGYGDSGYIRNNSMGWFNGTNMSYNAAPGGFSGGTMGMTLQLTNLVGGTCVTLFDVYQENNFAAHSCAGVTNNAYLAGNSGVTALPVAVTYTCGNSTYTVTPTPTPNVSYTLTYTRTSTSTPTSTVTATPTRTFTGSGTPTATPTRTFTGTPTWTYTTGVGGPIVLKSVNPSAASVGDNVTWTLFAQPGPATIGNVYSSGTAWAGTWTNQVAGSFSWAVSGGALWYDAVCGAETGFPQYIHSGVTVTGDVEFSYDTMIPSIGCQPLEDSVLIFRNVACNRFFMMRLDHYQGSDGCPSPGAGMSRLFYGKATPNGNACGDTSGYFNADTEVYGASIDCVVKNTWYSMKVKTCGTTIMAKTWQVGTAEPGNWQLSTTDSDLATYTSGSFGFQANTGQTAFRNLAVSTISTQNVTVTDALPNCLSNAALVGSPSKGSAVLSGNTVTWSVGTMGDCDLPAALTLSSKLSSCTAGSWVVNTANTANGLSGSASVWVATPNPVSIQLTKTIVSPTGFYSTGNIAVSINVCNASGSTTADAVSILDLVTQGGGNLVWCGPYSSYTLTAGGATVTIGAMMTQSTTAGMITVNNLPGGSCVPVTFCMTDYGIASHSCTTILDNAVASWSGGAVTSAQKAVTYDCPSSTPARTPTSTYTMTETPTPTISFTTTWTSTSTYTRTPSDTSTSTATPGTTATWTVGITPCDHIGIFGDSTIESTSSNTTGVVAANKYTFPVSSTLGSLSLYASGKGLFRLAVYSDNGMGTAPATLLVEAGPQTVDGAGWYTEAVSATTLAAGDYWLALQTDSGVTTYFNLNGTAMPYITQAFGNFPATYSGSTTCACSIITMRANTCYSGTPLPTATWTVTPLLTATSTPSSSPTRTYTPTQTGTPTMTFTTTETPTGTWYTATPTMTGTPTFTLTRTNTPSVTSTSTPSSTPTRTYTPTNTGTPTVTFTTTETPMGTWYTATPTMTGTPTFTLTRTNTPSVTWTGTASYTPTFTSTRTNTPSATATGTATYTPTATSTPTRTGTPTMTFTITETPTGTWYTATSTMTGTTTFTSTRTNTPSVTATGTPSSTPTRTYTPANTGTPTVTFTTTATPTGTWYTATPMMTGTPTFTLTRTNTPSVTSTGTPSSTPTRTYTPTNTGTPTVTFTTTETPTGTWYTATPTMTRTSTPTSTWSSTPIATWTPTVTSTATASYTLTPIYSFTRTGTPTSTQTATKTFTNTSTVSFTPSNTFVNTATVTPVFSQTRTLTPTATNNAIAVFTSTDTHTSTATFTPSATATQTVSSTATFTRTFTATQTFTVVFTDTSTSSMTPTRTSSWTDTPIATETSTVSPILTDTPVFTPNATNTPAQNVQEIAIGAPYPNPILDGSTVTLDLKVPAVSTVKWAIFTVSYRKIMNGSEVVSGSRARLVWDLKDDWGRPVSNGLYFMSVEITGSMNDKKIWKIMVAR